MKAVNALSSRFEVRSYRDGKVRIATFATPDNVRKVHALGQEYNVWTVNEAVDGDAMVAMGVDYITTNILEGTNKAE